MLLSGMAGDKHVIQVDKNISNIEQNLVHQQLECHSSIFQAKRHPDKLCLYFGDGDQNLEITHLEVQLGEDGAAIDTPSLVAHVGEGVLVIGWLYVELAKVAAWLLAAILFADHMEQAGPSTAWAHDHTSLKHLVKLGLGCRQAAGIQPTKPSVAWGPIVTVWCSTPWWKRLGHSRKLMQ
jgi:hypothetical protein